MSLLSYKNGGTTKNCKSMSQKSGKRVKKAEKDKIGIEHVWPVAVASNYSSIIPEMEHSPPKTRPPDHKKTCKYKYTFIKTRLSTIKFICFHVSLLNSIIFGPEYIFSEIPYICLTRTLILLGSFSFDNVEFSLFM